MSKKRLLILLAAVLTTSVQANEKQIYWGDTHLHTNRSFDAFTNRNFSVGPDEAYRFAPDNVKFILYQACLSWFRSTKVPEDFNEAYLWILK